MRKLDRRDFLSLSQDSLRAGVTAPALGGNRGHVTLQGASQATPLFEKSVLGVSA